MVQTLFVLHIVNRKKLMLRFFISSHFKHVWMHLKHFYNEVLFILDYINKNRKIDSSLF